MRPLTASLVDTDVFSLVYVSKSSNDSRVAAWKQHLTGRRVLISFQTRAEALSGARSRDWGATRMSHLMDILGCMLNDLSAGNPLIIDEDDYWRVRHHTAKPLVL